MITPHDPDLVPHDGFHNCPPIPHGHLMVSPPIGIGPRGPEGPVGPQGPKGDTGEFNTPTASVDNGSGIPYIEISSTGEGDEKVFNFAFHNMKGDTFTFDDLTNEQLSELRKDVASVYYRKDEQSVNITSGFPITTIEIPFADFRGTDILLVDINGLDLAETTEYYIDDGDIILGTPLTHSAKVNFKRMTALALSPSDFGDLAGGDIADAVEAWLDDHPEATTTVQDNSITNEKLVQQGGILSDVETLKKNQYISTLSIDSGYHANASKAISASPTSIVVNGKSWQDGTPSIQNPVPFKSVDELVIHVSTDGENDVTGWPVTVDLQGYELRGIPNGVHDELTIEDNHINLLQRVGTFTLKSSYSASDIYSPQNTNGKRRWNVEPGMQWALVDNAVNTIGLPYNSINTYNVVGYDHFCFGQSVNTYWKLYFIIDLGSEPPATNVRQPYADWMNANVVNSQFLYPYKDEVTIDLGSIVLPDLPDGDFIIWIEGGSANPDAKFTYVRDLTAINDDMQLIAESIDAINSRNNEIEERLDNVFYSGDICDMNSDSVDKILAARFNGAHSRNSTTIVHFSDIHGDGTRFNRIVKYMQRNSSMIDDAICTGDIVNNMYYDDFDTWWTANNILTCMGNHDTRLTESGWTSLATQQQMYEKFIGPFVPFWGSSLHIASNTTYYYKDYASTNLRLIVLNHMLLAGEKNAQITWLNSVLNDSITNGLHVMVAVHTQPYQWTRVESSFSSPGDYSSSQFSTDKEYFDCINDFKDHGGVFVGWISGHRHSDKVMTPVDYPDQIVFNIGLSKLTNPSDMERMAGRQNEDLFNVVTVDTTNNLVTLVRIGGRHNHQMKPRNYLCYDYSNNVIVSQG